MFDIFEFVPYLLVWKHCTFACGVLPTAILFLIAMRQILKRRTNATISELEICVLAIVLSVLWPLGLIMAVAVLLHQGANDASQV